MTVPWIFTGSKESDGGWMERSTSWGYLAMEVFGLIAVMKGARMRSHQPLIEEGCVCMCVLSKGCVLYNSNNLPHKQETHRFNGHRHLNAVLCTQTALKHCWYSVIQSRSEGQASMRTLVLLKTPPALKNLLHLHLRIAGWPLFSINTWHCLPAVLQLKWPHTQQVLITSTAGGSNTHHEKCKNTHHYCHAESRLLFIRVVQLFSFSIKSIKSEKRVEKACHSFNLEWH